MKNSSFQLSEIEILFPPPTVQTMNLFPFVGPMRGTRGCPG